MLAKNAIQEDQITGCTQAIAGKKEHKKHTVFYCTYPYPYTYTYTYTNTYTNTQNKEKTKTTRHFVLDDSLFDQKAAEHLAYTINGFLVLGEREASLVYFFQVKTKPTQRNQCCSE